MKRKVLLFLFIMSIAMLCAAVGITSVNMEDHDSAVVRVVIGLSAEGNYSINAGGNGLEFKLDNFITNSKARIATKDSNLVTAIEQDEEVLRISISKPYRYETTTFSYPRRIAIDIFKKNPSKAERLAIADFYAEMGKLNSADKTYSDLHIDYREDAQILYKWAVLLQKRGSARATEKLALIPASSPYFKKAQILMAKLHGEEEPLPPPPSEPEPILQDSIAAVPVVPVKPPVKVNPPLQVKTKSCPILGLCGNLGVIPLLLVLGLMVALGVFIFILAIKMKPPVKREESPIVESDLALDTKTMCKMVSKLLSDGWSMREISKELKISLREVELLVQMCHSGGHEDTED